MADIIIFWGGIAGAITAILVLIGIGKTVTAAVNSKNLTVV